MPAVHRAVPGCSHETTRAPGPKPKVATSFQQGESREGETDYRVDWGFYSGDVRTGAACRSPAPAGTTARSGRKPDVGPRLLEPVAADAVTDEANATADVSHPPGEEYG